jgi:Flp pilus assembly pilin Flp
MIRAFLMDQNGSTAVEYAAIGCFLSILVYAGAQAIGRTLADKHFGGLLKAWATAAG